MDNNTREHTDSKALLRANKRLERAVAELSLLNDFALDIGISRDSDAVMRKIVGRSIRAVDGEQGMITLLTDEIADPGKTLVRSNVTALEQDPIHMNTNLLGWMVHYQKPLILNDPHHDDRFRGVRWNEDVRSLLCVPLMMKSRLTGILTVFNKRKHESFDEEDQRLLAIIASQSAQIIENARLYEKEQELLRIQEQMKIASKIQADLLPRTVPHVPGYDIAGRSIPAQEVGGDYFDFISMRSGELAFIVGDVSGKGLPASLLMANTQAALRGQALVETSPRTIIARSNTLLYGSTDSGKFVTLFLGVLDPSSNEIRYANGGHNSPFLFAGDAAPVPLTAHGMMLGFMEDFDFDERMIHMSPGDLLVAYSDGITEAMNSAGEQFGEQRLVDAVHRFRQASADELLDGLVSTVCRHAADCPQFDDMTLVIIKRT